ncbi:hypothetical protein ACIBG8_35495 [Nonomuraea sp. NPDC050556]|uniref:hypothetical protein n=1 Tax=Nonomuraea sp. NPDC050556 TaxID=3364369 RepID=UPI0037BDA92F
MKMRIAAVLTLALGALAVPGTASADHHHGDAVRYASVKGCDTKDGSVKPCGPWRLVMHSGAKRLLKDAEVIARTASGKSSGNNVAPIAVSGNGQRIAYFAKAGGLVVRTLGGGVRAQVGLPRVAQYDVTLQLSDDGSRLAAVISGEKPKATRIFDTASGKLLGKMPTTESFIGFSADADEVLTGADGEESTYDLHVYGTDGKQVLANTPPQVVASNGPQALAADGRTVASMVMGGKPELVLYDLESDQATGRFKVKLPAGDLYKIDWTGESQVTLHLANMDGTPTKMTIVQIDSTSGAVRVRDSYTMLTDTFVFAACGG